MCIPSGSAAMILQTRERSAGVHVVRLPVTFGHAIVAATTRGTTPGRPLRDRDHDLHPRPQPWPSRSTQPGRPDVRRMTRLAVRNLMADRYAAVLHSLSRSLYPAVRTPRPWIERRRFSSVTIVTPDTQ